MLFTYFVEQQKDNKSQLKRVPSTTIEESSKYTILLSFEFFKIQ